MHFDITAEDEESVFNAYCNPPLPEIPDCPQLKRTIDLRLVEISKRRWATQQRFSDLKESAKSSARGKGIILEYYDVDVQSGRRDYGATILTPLKEKDAPEVDRTGVVGLEEQEWLLMESLAKRCVEYGSMPDFSRSSTGGYEELIIVNYFDGESWHHAVGVSPWHAIGSLGGDEGFGINSGKMMDWKKEVRVPGMLFVFLLMSMERFVPPEAHWQEVFNEIDTGILDYAQGRRIFLQRTTLTNEASAALWNWGSWELLLEARSSKD